MYPKSTPEMGMFQHETRVPQVLVLIFIYQGSILGYLFLTHPNVQKLVTDSNHGKTLVRFHGSSQQGIYPYSEWKEHRCRIWPVGSEGTLPWFHV